jgi:hypothetical protein
MRKLTLVLAAAALFASCKKSDPDPDPVVDPTPTGPYVSQQNLAASMSAGTTLRFNGINSNGGGVITIPQSGSGQTWNFASAPVAFQDSMVTGAATNSAFPTANFSRVLNVSFGNGSTMQNIPQTHYYEITANGWSELGYSMPAFTISYPGVGSIAFAAQNDTYTPTKLPYTTRFPMQVNDSATYNTAVTENSVANAPTYFINNAPSAQKWTYSGKIKAIASGNVSLPGYTSPLPAVIVRRDQNVTLNFLLNGVTPPAALLQPLGIVDGQTTSTTYYDIYHTGNIGYLGFIAVQNGAVTYSYLRRP